MRLLVIMTLFFHSTMLGAQTKADPVRETPLYRVYYEHDHLRDLSKPEEVYKENMLLLAGDERSLFLSHDKLLHHVANRAHLDQEISMGNTNMRMKPGRVVIPEEILIRYGEETATINTYLALHYHYTEPLAPIDWEIHDEQKDIEGLTCYRATTDYRGRRWEVWFSPEIAVPAGPWLLQGLPGLIVEARDSKGEVSYSLMRIESADVHNELIEQIPDYQTIGLSNKDKSRLVTKAAFHKMQEAAFKDGRAFMIAQIQAVPAQSNLFDWGVTNRSSWAKAIPNPIALTEN